MDIDIASLEAKVERVAEFCEQLRTENHALRERVAHLEQENSELTQRMKSARERIETLMEKLSAE